MKNLGQNFFRLIKLSEMHIPHERAAGPQKASQLMNLVLVVGVWMMLSGICGLSLHRALVVF